MLDRTTCFMAAALLGAASTLGCGSDVALFGDATGAGGGGTGGGAGGTGASTSVATTGTGGQPMGCTVDADCVLVGDACHTGACVSGTCQAVYAGDGALCNDGSVCTDGDTCQGGVCVSGPPKSCPSTDACHVGFCNESSGACDVMPGNDGASCDDGDLCTGPGICTGGACAKGVPIDCSALNGPCSIGVCQGGQGCVAAPANDGAQCNDGLFCTDGDHCAAGVCGGGFQKSCAQPANPCLIGTCDESSDACVTTPGNDGQACSDGSACTAGEKCSGGLCTGGAPANEGQACDDGSACTTGDACTGGLCTGVINGVPVYFSEDFSDNSQGWTLGQEWQIGPATLSVTPVFGPDPDVDHSASADDGVAGVVIGGNASPDLHPYEWLESPPFDASGNTPVILGFWRWLNSDYKPWMTNRIEVWNGSAWVMVWESGAQQIEDSEWKYIEHDLTAHKNAAMRIRFGITVEANGAFTVSSWNIDDVLVAGVSCGP